MYKFTITNDSITVIVEGKVVTVHEGAANFNTLRDVLMRKDWGAVPGALSANKTLGDWLAAVGSDFAVDHDTGKISYKGDPLPDSFESKLHELAKRGDSPLAMINFYTRLQRNPSYRSVQQLWNFIGQFGIPLSEDGCFLGYKKVREDLLDFYTGTIKNEIGAVIKMERNKISDDPEHACHFGLHVGALKYASEDYEAGSGRIVIVKVDPEHVVSVPNDHSCQKMRVCEYVVFGHYAGRLDNLVHEDELDDEITDSDLAEGRFSFDVTDITDDVDSDNTDSKWDAFTAMTMGELLEQPIMALRRYAGHGLKLIGASKIPGGKAALVKRILKVR